MLRTTLEIRRISLQEDLAVNLGQRLLPLRGILRLRIVFLDRLQKRHQVRCFRRLSGDGRAGDQFSTQIALRFR